MEVGLQAFCLNVKISKYEYTLIHIKHQKIFKHICDDQLQSIFFGKDFKSGDCLILFRNFVNLLTSYLFRFISLKVDLSRNAVISPLFQSDSSRPGDNGQSPAPDPLNALRTIFKRRICPFAQKKLKIKGWIPLPHRTENILIKVLFEYNKASPGFILILKKVFDHLSVPGRGRGVLAGELWRLLVGLRKLKQTDEEKKRFFQILERHFDPMDTVSNYVLRIGKFDSPVFRAKAKLCMNMDLDFQEFVLCLSFYYFLSENERFSSVVSNLKTMTPLFYEMNDNLMVIFNDFIIDLMMILKQILI